MSIIKKILFIIFITTIVDQVNAEEVKKTININFLIMDMD